MHYNLPSRTKVRTVSCPHCGAAADEKCRSVRRKPRESNHQERVDTYLGQQTRMVLSLL